MYIWDVKGTVQLISSESLFEKWHVRFTMVPWYTLDECRDIETRLVQLELLFPLFLIRPRFTGCPCESKMPVYKWKVT